VEGIQEKVGISEVDLKCGIHPPIHRETAEAMRQRGEAPTPNRHNCSGKHTGMLAHARMRSASLENYLDFEHPVQRSILLSFAEMCKVSPESVGLGIDGCSAPVFSIPLYNAAWGLARLADPQGLSSERAAACRTITDAMMSHPHMVAGPDRFDTILMQVANQRIVVKGGAEGYQGMALMPGAMGKNSSALGVALKVSDGDGRGRVRPGVCIEVLRQLGALSQNELKALERFGPVNDVINWRDIVVGEGRPIFTLMEFEG
jgi:L-asparaginase II